MKNIFIMLFLTAGTFCASAQIGIKGGLVYNGEGGMLKAAESTYKSEGSTNIGWQAGLVGKIDLAVLTVEPEILYTSFKNEYVTANNTEFAITRNRVDIPINVGVNFSILRLHAGPVFTYYLDDKNSLKDIVNAHQDNFNLGAQIGLGLQFKQLYLNARYEMSITKTGSAFEDAISNTRYSTENRPHLLNVSLTYYFN
ncbi:MAG TPA: outer membrane beta-barrel protein [Flavobacterium sp.]|nr:outer membrane beta-barrel protein [Flavobacterium sp.]